MILPWFLVTRCELTLRVLSLLPDQLLTACSGASVFPVLVFILYPNRGTSSAEQKLTCQFSLSLT
jgi:hypothetical protein